VDPELLRAHLMAFPETTEETPFDADTVTYKSAGKVFAIINWKREPLRINLKCDPAKAEELRETYAFVQPGYHMNKKHWNTVSLEGADPTLVIDWVKHSFECVLKGMPKKVQERLRKQIKEIDLAAPPVPERDSGLRNQMAKEI
jgi:predicted DNA-binding protein (MmcQ/YjbR family)